MRMRDLLQIVESPAPVLYHGSRRKFSLGTILAPQKRGYVHGTGMDREDKKAHAICENALEHYRPSDAVSRLQAMFMCDDYNRIEHAGGYSDYIYEVEPIGHVTKANLYWYSSLVGFCYDVMDQGDEHDIRTMARSYWAAAPNDLDEPHRDLFEYLAASARIIRVL